MVGGKSATYSQESKLAQKREARRQNLAEEGNLEAKMQSKINQKSSKMKAKRQPKGLYREAKGSEAVHEGLGLILRRSWRGLEAVLERSWAALGTIVGAPGPFLGRPRPSQEDPEGSQELPQSSQTVTKRRFVQILGK